MSKYLIAMLIGMVISVSAIAAEPGANTEVPQTFTQAIAFEGQCPQVEEFSSLKADSPLLAQGCCKVCRQGKACGNSCISRSYTCHQPPGCACDG